RKPPAAGPAAERGLLDCQLETVAGRVGFAARRHHQSQTRPGGGAQSRPPTAAGNLPVAPARPAATDHSCAGGPFVHRRQTFGGCGTRFFMGDASGENAERTMSPGQFILTSAVRVYRLALSPAKMALFGPLGRC